MGDCWDCGLVGGLVSREEGVVWVAIGFGGGVLGRYTWGMMATAKLQGVCNVPNRTIFEGDNLDVMRGMNDGCVDLIYLDPPFNSNRDYAAPIGSRAAGAAFKDTWDLTDVDEAWHNEIAEADLALYKVIDASEHSHGSGMKSYLIMMAVRLLEMRRILKSTGSIYLHCDPTASHYLKSLMDSVFGRRNFRNEITWKRTNSHNDARRNYSSIGDYLLFYTKSDQFTFQTQHTPYSEEHIAKSYRYVDEKNRRYTTRDLRSPQPRPNLTYDYKGYSPHANGWSVSLDRMKQLDAEGRLHFPKSKDGRIRLKRYLDEMPGVPAANIWDDIKPVQSQAQERLGYPTQKPLALLERIIKASSNDGDVVLDPFCGCATTCIAAERLDRQWIGIDLSELAVKLVEQRARNELGLMGGVQAIARSDIPKRTDREPAPPLSESKVVLYGTQGGNCNGCGTHFLPQHLTVDHIVAQSKGGTDHVENLQLLCGHCNSLKGDRPMEYLRARLVRGFG